MASDGAVIHDRLGEGRRVGKRAAHRGDSRTPSSTSLRRGGRVRTVAAVPMIRGSTVVGLVLLRRRRARAFAHM